MCRGGLDALYVRQSREDINTSQFKLDGLKRGSQHCGQMKQVNTIGNVPLPHCERSLEVAFETWREYRDAPSGRKANVSTWKGANIKHPYHSEVVHTHRDTAQSSRLM